MRDFCRCVRHIFEGAQSWICAHTKLSYGAAFGYVPPNFSLVPPHLFIVRQTYILCETFFGRRIWKMRNYFFALENACRIFFFSGYEIYVCSQIWYTERVEPRRLIACCRSAVANALSEGYLRYRQGQGSRQGREGDMVRRDGAGKVWAQERRGSVTGRRDGRRGKGGGTSTREWWAGIKTDALIRRHSQNRLTINYFYFNYIY